MPQTQSFVIVGLTGGIASGKTIVAEMIADRGAPVIDADDLARQVVEPGQPALDDIRDTFGGQVFHKDGTLDRQALGDVVFADAAARKKLDAITHPRIGRAMTQRADQYRQAGHHWVVYEAALIVEKDLHHGLDSLIVVAADRHVQRHRLIARDGLTQSDARNRIAAQLPLADKVAVADYVVDNNDALDHTRSQVARIYEQIDDGVRTRGTGRPPSTEGS